MANATKIKLIVGRCSQNHFCASVLEPTTKPRKKLAFTLAEVLITLGIIGIVAAMVIPSLVSNYQERYTVTRLRKTYAILQQAIKLSISENGEPGGWNIPHSHTTTNARKAAAYIVPYLKIVKDCNTRSGCIAYTKKVKLLNGKQHNINYDTDNRYYKIILADSTYLVIRAPLNTDPDGRIMGIFTDINGPKEPNTVGKDIFSFGIQDNILFPGGIRGDYTDCQKNGQGWSCTDYVLKTVI